MNAFSAIIQQLVNAIVLASAYCLVSIGLTLIYGILNVINFAQGEFFMVGAFTAMVFSKFYGLSFFWSLILTLLLACVFGFIVERVAFRPLLRTRNPLNFALSTLGISIIFSELALHLFGADPIRPPTGYKNQVFEFGGIVIDTQRIIVVVVAIVLVIVLTIFVQKTRLGLAMRACAQDRLVAQLMGVRINQISTVVVCLSFTLAAAAGSLLGPIYLVKPIMGTPFIMKAFAIVVLGGMGSVPGAIVGSLILAITETIAAAYIGTNVRDIIAFVVVIFTLVALPHGIMGTRGE